VNERYPGVRLAGCRDGYFAPEENAAVVAAIRKARPDVLLVAFGAPRQELWLDQWSAELEVPVSFGVGGLFDFYSGRIRRAPLWMRETGLEWVYRLIQEPRRMWKRYLVGNVVFLYRVWRYGRNACSNK
jgi:N-acetylglucosaminyldiphosphoundecaprenol N-acetyl-beta-D-mannosaminyltransferase